MRVLTFLIYTILWQGLTLGGCGYAVFVRGYSGWWFVLAMFLSGNQYGPENWAKLWRPLVGAPKENPSPKPDRSRYSIWPFS